MQSIHILTTTSWQYDSRSRPLCTPSLGVGFVQEQMGSAKGVDGIFPKLQAFRRTEVRPLRLEIRGIVLKSLVGLQAFGSTLRPNRECGRLPRAVRSSHSQKLVVSRILFRQTKTNWTYRYIQSLGLHRTGFYS